MSNVMHTANLFGSESSSAQLRTQSASATASITNSRPKLTSNRRDSTTPLILSNRQLGILHHNSSPLCYIQVKGVERIPNVPGNRHREIAVGRKNRQWRLRTQQDIDRLRDPDRSAVELDLR